MKVGEGASLENHKADRIFRREGNSPAFSTMLSSHNS